MPLATTSRHQPAGVLAKRQRPDSIVVTFAGDGDFLMTGQELATVALGLLAVAAVKGLSGEQKKAAKEAVEAHKKEREEFKKKVTQDPNTEALRRQAVADGMRPLRLAGALRVAEGLTVIPEVLSSTPSLS